MQTPKINGRPPSMPVEMIGPMNEKLVPCMHSSPVPTPPIRRHWMKVDNPDAKRAIETRNPVVSWSSPSAPAMISGGVTIAMKIASRCCKAAKKASLSGGRSSMP